jgi:ABC-type polysaccharide/polyol phosphate export permease
MSSQTERRPPARVDAPVAEEGPRRLRREDEFTGEHHVYEPHRVGLPPIGSYVRELWRRREFALEMSRTALRAQHFNTVFGQLWLVINPLLLALVYFILVDILHRGAPRGVGFFAHLMAGLFTFYFVSGAVREGAKSVVSGGRLILNTAFPRVLLPLSSVLTAFMRFVPTLVIYVPVQLAAGIAMLVAAAQVYFRDVSSFLPYVLRIWLYASPVLYYADEVPSRYQVILDLNPLAPLLTALSDVLHNGEVPGAGLIGAGLAWAVGIFIAGALFFVSREREFAVRL